MIRLAPIRRRTGLIRSVFAVFVLTWLQMAAVPCVVAGTVQPASFPSLDAQGGTADAGMGHESPDLAMSNAADGQHDCLYCPPPIGPDQAASMAHCFYPDQPQTDRGGHSQVGYWVLPAVPELRSFDSLVQRHLSRTLIQAAPPQPRPLNLTYCVQLK